jgi:hypothetical protein
MVSTDSYLSGEKEQEIHSEQQIMIPKTAIIIIIIIIIKAAIYTNRPVLLFGVWCRHFCDLANSPPTTELRVMPSEAVNSNLELSEGAIWLAKVSMKFDVTDNATLI